MQIAHINANGLKQISEALTLHHKLPLEHFTPAMLNAWAADAEDHFAEGNGCCFEISAHDSDTGTPVVVTIQADGYDLEDVTDDE